MRLMTACLVVCFAFAGYQYTVRTSAADDQKTPTEIAVKMSAFEGKQAEVMKVTVVKHEIKIKRGETFRVKLEANRTTGYSWQVLGPNYDPLELKKAHLEEAKAEDKKGAEDKNKHPRFGRPGTQVFEFVAKKDGDGTSSQRTVLVFNYGRPWEGLGKECYELTVTVEP